MMLGLEEERREPEVEAQAQPCLHVDSRARKGHEIHRFQLFLLILGQL